MIQFRPICKHPASKNVDCFPVEASYCLGDKPVYEIFEDMQNCWEWRCDRLLVPKSIVWYLKNCLAGERKRHATDCSLCAGFY